MTALDNCLARQPTLIRVLPFILFLLLSGLAGQFDGSGRFWIYLAKTMVGAVMLAMVWRHIAELKLSLSWVSLLAGLAVLGIWIGLEGFYPKIGKANPWNPFVQFGQESSLAWFFVMVRLAGSSLVVPPLEEVFYRSFVYRYVAQKDYLTVPLSRFLPVPFLITSTLFALEHQEWLPGLLAGFIYQWTVIKTGRLGDAISAHALTNFLLGLWVILKPAWQFW